MGGQVQSQQVTLNDTKVSGTRIEGQVQILGG